MAIDKHELREAMGAQHDRCPSAAPPPHPATAPIPMSVNGSVTPFDAGDAGRIGARAEQSRLAERCDAAIADDQIERKRQQRERDQPREKRETVGKREITHNAESRDRQRRRSRLARNVRASRAAPVEPRWLAPPASYCAFPRRPRGKTHTMAMTAA